MRTYLFEATNGFNWGKFCVGVMDHEWQWRSRVDTDDRRRLLAGRGWDDQHIWVMDLATGEGALFRHGGHAGRDLDKHKIWVCPLFEPFLEWFYKQDLGKLDELCAAVVQLPDAPSSLYGSRRRPRPVGAAPSAADVLVGQQGNVESDELLDEFDRLLDQSSVGTAVAKALQSLTPAAVFDRLEARLRDRVTLEHAIVRAPFTDEQVAGLNAYQVAANVHPFTCGNDSSHPVLVASVDGWRCSACEYTQAWAHRAAADGSLAEFGAEALRLLEEHHQGEET